MGEFTKTDIEGGLPKKRGELIYLFIHTLFNVDNLQLLL